MTGENIICFAKDWDEHPTSNNHVMRELARSNQVLWLNSVASRTPSLGDRRDLAKIWRKVAAALRGPRQVEKRLWVYTPLVIPLPHHPFARRLNAAILRLTVAVLRRRLGMRQFQLWTFLPNVADYARALAGSVVVYYCVDEFAGFKYLDSERISASEADLCQQADIVFGASRQLVSLKSRLNPKTYFAPHGVDHALFARALAPNTAIPEDLGCLPQPVLGFYGTLQEWVDLELLAYLAERHPEWTLVLIGRAFVDTARLERFPNVIFLGPRSHELLPAYCKGFSVGLIPYRLDERMQTVNPLKLREYLSAGVPVVSTAVPEVLPYREHCAVAEGFEEFERAVERAIATDSTGQRQARSEAMQSETWQRRVAEVGTRVMEIKGMKGLAA